MPLVNIMVNSRAYTVACDEGEEDHLRELASHVDSKVKELLSSVGQVGDQRLLLMAALLIADEHHEAARQLHLRTQELGSLSGTHEETSTRLAQSEAIAADALEAATKRLEDIAGTLGRA
ncbi:MAG: cell division protein ZapA [Alphaproteobacteria bacterium]|nr:cell division protein ZapA [Alphaproteobacteria bacterium]MBV9542706.1 cell division protein ZapA [Alphaproteobacteria bacterium]MBV9904109.1 cell division protein ZapA [Alphaproteobacteria bacterium]